MERLGFAPAGLQDARDFQDRGDAGGVVHGAVVEGVAVDGAADAEMVEVRRHDDVFVLSACGSAPGNSPTTFGASTRLALDGRLGAQRPASGNLGSGLILSSERFDLLEGVAAAGEKLRSAPRRVMVRATCWPADSWRARSARTKDGGAGAASAAPRAGAAPVPGSAPARSGADWEAWRCRWRRRA